MVHWLKGIFFTSLLAAVITGLFILPDSLFKLYATGYRVTFESNLVIAFYLMTWIALASPSIYVIRGLVILFGILQLAQFYHFAYFGTLISPHAVSSLFSELGEITESLFAETMMVFVPLVIILAVYGSIFWILNKFAGYRQTIPFVGFALLLILSLGPLRAFEKYDSHPQEFYGNPRHYAIANTYNAVSFFLGSSLASIIQGREFADYKRYVVSDTGGFEPVNIVVVMGESANPDHMNVLGYDRDTTPNLSKLSGSVNFVAKRAISSGINTKVAIPTFFNLKHKPNNVQHLMKEDANLMAMAKNRGMTTHFISTQKTSNLAFMGEGHIDYFFDKEDDNAAVETKHDELLVEKLEKIELGKSNFIVLHQRGSHSPYGSFQPAEFGLATEDTDDAHSRRINTYDNSIFYTDHVLSRIIEVVQSKSELPAYIVFVLDHGQLLGVNGKYGHNMLEPGVANTPFLFYSINGDSKFVQQAKAFWYPTHYEIGMLIAEILGYRVDNPNAVAEQYYVNGLHMDGSAGHMLVLKKAGETPQWNIVH